MARNSVGDAPETGMPSILERSPLLDRREIRSFTNTSTANSRSRSAPHHISSLKAGPAARPSKAVAERQRRINPVPSYQRTRSVPLHWNNSSPQNTLSCRSSPAFRSSPQYRVNPAVRFDERLLPERMNYGIAGYNTSRPRSWREWGLVPIRRPRSLQIWKLWTRRFKERMTRSRVKTACSRLMTRFRRRH